MSAEVRQNLLLAFTETRNNVVKHPQPTEVGVSLTLAEAAFTLVIEDNGRAFVFKTAAMEQNLKHLIQSTAMDF